MRPNFSEPNSRAALSDGQVPAEQARAVLQAAQRVAQGPVAYGCSAHHQRAVGHGFRHGPVDLRGGHHGPGAHRRARFPERQVVGIDQPQGRKSEVGHGAGGRADVERVARADQHHAEARGHRLRLSPSARMRLCRLVRSMPERAGGAGDVPVGLFERAQDVLALGRFARLLHASSAAPSRACTRISTGIESRVRRSPGVRIAMRSTTLRSSRALPGQA